ncbi:MAG: hypothetical protein ACRDQA_05335 [Nocardioidaceae bacterium]
MAQCTSRRRGQTLYDLRNHLAHRRLPDIDEALVQRVTWLRLDAIREQVRAALH